MVRKKYKTLYLPEGGSIKKRKRTKRRRRLHRRLRGKDIFTDLLKSTGKAVAAAREAAKTLCNIVGAVGKRTKNKTVRRILNSDITKAGIDKLRNVTFERIH